MQATLGVTEIELPGLEPWRRGKVRSVYEADDRHLVIVASDRLSAYDSVLPTPITGKGAVLTQLSIFWFERLASARPHHFVSAEPRQYPAPFDAHVDRLEGRSMLVRRADRVDIECVVRGYLTGSGWKEYQKNGQVCGIALPSGLRDGSKLEPAIFTPATKEEHGHDENISFERMVSIVGADTAHELRDRSLAIYEEARAIAWERGLVLADTKFEFGRVDGRLTLIDEILSPDSSRYWDRAEYEAGRLLSFDKQYVRDWLDQSGWDHEPPAPALPDEVVRRTSERYQEAMQRLMGDGVTEGWPRAALLSLSDKSGAAEFARALVAGGSRLLASGGTAKHLADAGLDVTAVEEWTGFPEMLGGRVKTLHPHVHAPILARREVAGDLAALAERGLEPIDLVAVTLYPFEERAAALDDAGAIEEIDIGGVALLRAAAKNHDGVIVIHDPAQYTEVLAALRTGVRPEQRRRWATRAFARTARYDGAIAAELARRESPSRDEASPPAVHVAALERVRTLRYGENPHQAAALYAPAGEVAALESWQEGEELSYNNLLDLEAAVVLAGRFAAPACVIVKHNQPCGAASARTLGEAYALALKSDEQSAFGGIVAFNRTLDAATAQSLSKQFVECVSAPDYESGAADALKQKKNLRVVKLAAEAFTGAPWTPRAAGRWTLLQHEPAAEAPPWRVVTSRAPSPDEEAALRFAWEVAAAARSNAIAIARGTALIGLGSGQTSRVDAVDVALMKAKRSGHDVKGAVLASDGFFPFADNVEHAAAAGLTAIVQPGGSMRDAEVIAACDAHGVAMMFTERRTFRH